MCGFAKATAEELKWAFDQLHRLDLHAADYTKDLSLMKELRKQSKDDAIFSAGCMVGVRLGLLIAYRRMHAEEAKDPLWEVAACASDPILSYAYMKGF